MSIELKSQLTIESLQAELRIMQQEFKEDSGYPCIILRPNEILIMNDKATVFARDKELTPLLLEYRAVYSKLRSKPSRAESFLIFDLQPE